MISQVRHGGWGAFLRNHTRGHFTKGLDLFSLKEPRILIFLDSDARATRLLYGPRFRMQHSKIEPTGQVPQLENLSGDGGA